MNITLKILDNNFNGLQVVEGYGSLIWSDRYDEFGDFELLVLPTSENLVLFQQGYYLALESSEHVMIIESVEVKTDDVEGDFVYVKGRSFESILFRRIVWDQTILSGNLQTEVQRLLNENAISPVVGARDIPGLAFASSVDPDITSLTIDGQYCGEYLYDVISSICKSRNIGFKIVPNTTYTVYNFSLYAGTDRSYNQSTNDYVIFSPTFDNVVKSDYFTSDVILKTVGLVFGEGEGTDRLTATVVDGSGGGSGLARREIAVDGSDLSKTTSGGTLTDPDYLYLLDQRGQEALSQNRIVNHFEGEIVPDILYIYGEDFFMGDIVQIENRYGNGGSSRVVEFVFSNDSSGSNFYPTFSGLN